MSWSPSQNWSGDFYFLTNINSLLQAFTLSHFEDDLMEKYNSLVMLDTIISPKIKTNFDKEMKWLTANIYKIEQKDPTTGKTLSVNVPLKQSIKEYMQRILKQMLIELEREGIYTKKVQDPRKAMGNFGGS